jgi:hypothetical protein
MRNYVIYRLDSKSKAEIYVDTYQSLKSTLIEITNHLDEAKKFDTAREAYEWARFRNLDQWRVGRR